MCTIQILTTFVLGILKFAAAQCPNGYSPYIETNGQPRLCTPTIANSCQVAGFTCMFVQSRYQCCGLNQGCPTGTAAHGTPYLQCSAVNQQSTCPVNFMCRQSTTLNIPICCATNGLATCPNGAVPLTIGGNSVTCQSDSTCPQGTVCLTNTQTNTRMCCPTGICSAGNPLADTLGNLQTCSFTVPCPTSYQCTYNKGKAYCCATAQSVCSLPPDSGTNCATAGTPRKMYYYNPSRRQCYSFTYNCGGNNNRFFDWAACIQFCRTASSATTSVLGSCPSGMTPFYVSGTSQPQSCSLNVANTCTQGNCVMSTRNYPICCTSTTSSTLCSNNLQPYVTPGTTVVQRCVVTNNGGCPNGYICQGTGVCCPTSATNTCGTCPTGSTPYYTPGTTQTTVCVGTFNCPVGYQCVSSPSCVAGQAATNLCCSSTPSTTNPNALVCPTGMTPYYIPGTTQTVACTLGVANSCVTGYACTRAGNAGTINNQFQNLCCSSTVNTGVTGTCPNNYATNNVQCTINVANACTVGYTCLSSVAGQAIGRCCQFSPACTVGGTLYISGTNAQPQICGTNLAACPTNYFCSASTAPGVSVCCFGTGTNTGTIGRCPNGQSGYVQPGQATPQLCTPNVINTCPGGYTCQQSSLPGRYYCCFGITALTTSSTCWNGQRAYIQPGQTQPLRCYPLGTAACPTSYSCQQSTIAGTYYCCLGTSSTTARCQNGQIPYVQPGQVNPTLCTLGSTNFCPSPYTCQASTVINTNYCCLGGSTTSVCANGLAPYVLPGTSVAQTCSTVGANTCPINYSCQPTAPFNTNYCCYVGNSVTNPFTIGTTFGTGTTQFLCPNGLRPYSTFSMSLTLFSINLPTFCAAGSTTTCPSGYSCQQSTTFGLYYCCPTSSTSIINSANAQCPTPYIAYQYSNGLPLSCPGTSAANCPAGYTCMASTRSGTLLCCGVGNGQLTTTVCANGAPAYYSAPGLTYPCSPLNAQCPFQYSCQATNLPNVYMCCLNRRHKRSSSSSVIMQLTNDEHAE